MDMDRLTKLMQGPKADIFIFPMKPPIAFTYTKKIEKAYTKDFRNRDFLKH